MKNINKYETEVWINIKSSLQIKQEGFSFHATTLLQGCKYATMPYNKTDLNFGNQQN